MTTPDEGVTETQALSINDASEAFLAKWADADEKPSDTVEEETSDEDDAADFDDTEDFESDDTEDPDSEDAEADQSESEDEPKEATDDHKVTVTVDGESKTVTVKELKRLYGQEASLTRKSQEVAAAKKAAEADAQRYLLANERMLAKAEERYAPYKDIDWMVAQQNLKPQEFAILRDQARIALEDLNFLKEEATGLREDAEASTAAQRAEAAKEALQQLEQTIPDWSKEVYNDIRSFAIAQGLDAQEVNNLLDPNAIRLLHDAMKYADMKKKAAAKKQQTKKKMVQKKVLKPSERANPQIGKQAKGTEALAALRKTGAKEDAANAFLARWEDSGDD